MISPAMVLPDTVPSVHTNCDLFTSTRDKLLPCIEGDSATGTGKLPERGIAGVIEFPKRLNDQKGWKRLQDGSLPLPDWTDYLRSIPGFEAYCTDISKMCLTKMWIRTRMRSLTYMNLTEITTFPQDC